MSTVIVGRDAELASIRDFVAGLVDGASALVVQGDAGVGKTTLWSAAVEEAEARGFLVLRARPAMSETALSFSGVGDLLDRVLGAALEPLPGGQRRALARALVLEDDAGPPPDPRAVGVAVLNAFRALAERQPTLVAVDDVQWLDAPSSGAISYAARRLEPEKVGLLLAHRTPLESGLVVELRRSLATERFSALALGPLDRDALHRVIQSHLETVLPRPLAAEVHEASGGNPFYALEIVRTLQRSGISIEAGHPLPVPDSLQELVHGRLLALPLECRVFLLAAAAHSQPTVSLTVQASGVGRDVGLVPALEAHIVELEGERIRFIHPLFAAGAYETGEPARRREVHARLAELLENPEARAWQLAASVTEPEDAVAAVLEEAARHARMRGAPRPAALLLDRARQLTPPGSDEDALRRALDAAFLHFESGDSRRAEAQMRDVIAPLIAGSDRAKALLVLARIRMYEGPHEAVELFLQAVDEAEDDQETLARAHEGVASCRYWMFERLEDALRHAEVALALAVRMDDETLAADVLLAHLGTEALLGRATAATTVDRAIALQGSVSSRRVLDQPLVALAEYWTWFDSHDRARATLVELLQRAQELGDENSRPYLLFLLGDLERTVGDLADACERARAGLEAAEQSGQLMFAACNLALHAHAEAQLGGTEQARQAANRALEIAPYGHSGFGAAAALGHLELVLGAPERALAHLEPVVRFVREEGIVEPGATRFVLDQVEALIDLGRRDEAAELLDWYEGNARRLERASALAAAGRCRGLLAAQVGALGDALTAYEDALAWHQKVELPLDRGRTLLAFGITQRRAKRRREARGTLEEALAVFERIGAALWAERTRAELRRISGRAPSPGALTPAEERVAALVAEGKTNREVAAALFVSERTVEGHLSRVFAKLGIRHRAQVAPALASRQTQGVAPSNTRDSPVSADHVAP